MRGTVETVKPAIETFQSPWELEHLVAAVERHAPARVLEIGVWDGGTLWHWLQIADKVVAVDDGMRREGDWYGWAQDADTDLTLIRSYSQEPEAVERAAEHAPYDLLFIDADHSYASVRADWDNYGPMVAGGGLVVFHDILPRPGYGVSQLWGELKSAEGSRWMEICQNEVAPGNEGLCGIGLLYL